MRSSTLSQYGLFAAAAVIVVLAVAVWTTRQPADSYGSDAGGSMAAPQRKQQHIQKAASLLFKAFHADNYLTYSADSKTMAMYGGGKMNSVAQITHAPQRFAIVYKSGAMKGLHTGYNQYWFWRQDRASSPLQPYAQIRIDTTKMATSRFALMLENYAARYAGTEEVDGRKAEIVELKPFQPAPGAIGPAKRLSIDQDTGLTIRVQTFNFQMRPVMESTLTNVDYAPRITPTTFRSQEQIHSASKVRDFVAQEEGADESVVEKRTGLQPPKPAYLPQGFVFDGVGMHKCNYAGSPYCASLTRYTDGLNTLTVFHLKQASGNKAATKGAPRAKGAPEIEEKPIPGGLVPGGPVPGGPAAQGKALLPGGGKLSSCEFGPGTLVTRNVPGGRLLAVADLPAPVLQQVLASVTIGAPAADAVEKPKAGG